MSPGNRHDMYIGAETFWNLMKLIKLSMHVIRRHLNPTLKLHTDAQLYNDLVRAAENKDQKLRVFLSHCVSYADQVPEWNKLSRDAREKQGKEVLCVYQQTPSKCM